MFPATVWFSTWKIRSGSRLEMSAPMRTRIEFPGAAPRSESSASAAPVSERKKERLNLFDTSYPHSHSERSARDFREVFHDVRSCNDVRVLGVHIEEVYAVRKWSAVRYALAGDDDAESAGDGIADRSADASARGVSGDDCRIDSKRCEDGLQMRPVKAAWKFFRQEDVATCRRAARIDLRKRTALNKLAQQRDLPNKRPAVGQMRWGVRNGCVNDGDVATARHI